MTEQEQKDFYDLIASSKIRNVYAKYTIALDTHAWELLGQCFTEDAIIQLGQLSAEQNNGSSFTTPKGWARMCADVLPKFDATQHFALQVLIEVDGDTANARCYFLAHHVTSGGPRPYFIIGGWYTDTFVRQGDQWLIARRVGTPVWYENIPAALSTIPSGATKKTENHGAPAWCNSDKEQSDAYIGAR